MSEYATFEDWWNEVESYSTRSERAHDDLGPDAERWLRVAWQLGALSRDAARPPASFDFTRSFTETVKRFDDLPEGNRADFYRSRPPTNNKETTMRSYILIDRSGSMASNWAETLGSVNGYVETLAKDGGTKKTKITVAFFDDTEPFAVARTDVKAKDWTALTDADATPRGTTPLFDAVGSLANLIDKADPKRASVVVVTDGVENASKEVSKEAAKARLDAMRKKGYDVVFLGADFDAFNQAGSLGNATGQTINAAKGSYAATMSMLASRTSAYAQSGKVADFTNDDRKRAAGK